MSVIEIVKRALVLLLVVLTVLGVAGCGGSGPLVNPGRPVNEAPQKQMGGAVQGRALAVAGTEWTFAGAGVDPSTNLFSYCYGIVAVGPYLYVADTQYGVIRKVEIATGAVTTFAGGTYGSADGTGTAAQFEWPWAMTTDGTNLYVTDAYASTIRKVKISTAEVTTLAGSAEVRGSADGIGSAARFNSPWGITTDGTNLYVSDNANNTIRKVVIATGEVSTLAGSAGVSGVLDGTGSNALFNGPYSITTDGTSLYVTDNHSSVRKIAIESGTVTTLTNAFSSAAGITTDGTSLYVADQAMNIICKLDPSTGAVTTLAGSADKPRGSANGIGSAARFAAPSAIVAAAGNLYVTDTENHTIRKVSTATGAVTTVLQSAVAIGANDGTGVAARFNSPQGITTDGTNLYVADTENGAIRKIAIATGAVATLAGSADNTKGSDDGIGAAASFNYPTGVTTDGTNVYVADCMNHTIRKIEIATGAVTTLAGSAGEGGETDGTGSAARFTFPYALTTDGSNLYVVSEEDDSIRKIVIETGAVTTVVQGTSPSPARRGITTDGTYLYVADSSSKTIKKVTIATGAVTTLAGASGSNAIVDGVGSVAQFSLPFDITTDGTNLYVTDSNTVRKIVIATGAVTTAWRQVTYGWFFGITTDGRSLYAVDPFRNSVETIR